MRVALFATCVNDAVLPRAAIATVRLLERLGVEVDFPEQQSCCGQPQFNTGCRQMTEPLVRRMARVFDDYEYVVVPSGSCAAMVRDNYPRIGAKARAEGRGEELEQAAATLTPRVLELTEFLVDVLGATDVGAYFPHTVTYHPSCHGLRILGLGARPLALLQAVKGLKLMELPGAEECCGFGGTFAVKNPDVSAPKGADKIRNARSTGAQMLCGADNSCLMHLDGLLRRKHAPLRTLHLAEILASTETEPGAPHERHLPRHARLPEGRPDLHQGRTAARQPAPRHPHHPRAARRPHLRPCWPGSWPTAAPGASPSPPACHRPGSPTRTRCSSTRTVPR